MLVVAKKPIEKAKRIALDTSSRSSAALVRMLAAEHWGIQPEFVDAAPTLRDAEKCRRGSDDRRPCAAYFAQNGLSRRKSPSGESAAKAIRTDACTGIRDAVRLRCGVSVAGMTAKPCVLAIWAARRDVVTPELVADFQASKEYGLERMREIAEGASLKLDLPARALERY